MIAPPTLKHPYLQTRVNELVALQNAVDAHFKDIELNKFNFKPAPKVWSIAECMQHLLLVYSKYQPYLQTTFEQTLPTAEGEIVYQPTWIGKQFMKFVNPDKMRKIPAPPMFHPTRGSSHNLALIDRFKMYLEDVQSYIERTDAENIDFNKVKVRTSLSAWFKFSLGDYFQVETMHSRRHFAQMLRVQEQMKA